MKVGADGRRLALLAVDKEVRGMDCRIPPNNLNTFQKMTITYDDFLIFMRQRINDGNNDEVTCCRNLEYETDLAGARPPYSRVTKIHDRKVKFTSWT